MSDTNMTDSTIPTLASLSNSTAPNWKLQRTLEGRITNSSVLSEYSPFFDSFTPCHAQESAVPTDLRHPSTKSKTQPDRRTITLQSDVVRALLLHDLHNAEGILESKAAALQGRRECFEMARDKFMNEQDIFTMEGQASSAEAEALEHENLALGWEEDALRGEERAVQFLKDTIQRRTKTVQGRCCTMEMQHRTPPTERETLDQAEEALNKAKLTLQEQENNQIPAAKTLRAEKKIFNQEKKAYDERTTTERIIELLEDSTYDEVTAVFHLALRELAVENTQDAILNVIFEHVIKPQLRAEETGETNFGTLKLLNEHLLKPAFAAPKTNKAVLGKPPFLKARADMAERTMWIE